jgi:hypothetical protein
MVLLPVLVYPKTLAREGGLAWRPIASAAVVAERQAQSFDARAAR